MSSLFCFFSVVQGEKPMDQRYLTTSLNVTYHPSLPPEHTEQCFKMRRFAPPLAACSKGTGLSAPLCRCPQRSSGSSPKGNLPTPHCPGAQGKDLTKWHFSGMLWPWKLFTRNVHKSPLSLRVSGCGNARHALNTWAMWGSFWLSAQLGWPGPQPPLDGDCTAHPSLAHLLFLLQFFLSPWGPHIMPQHRGLPPGECRQGPAWTSFWCAVPENHPRPSNDSLASGCLGSAEIQLSSAKGACYSQAQVLSPKLPFSQMLSDFPLLWQN